MEFWYAIRKFRILFCRDLSETTSADARDSAWKMHPHRPKMEWKDATDALRSSTADTVAEFRISSSLLLPGWWHSRFVFTSTFKRVGFFLFLFARLLLATRLFFVPRVTLPKNVYPEESDLTINVVDERESLTSDLSPFSRITRYIILVFNETAFQEFYLLLYSSPNFLDFSLDYIHNLMENFTTYKILQLGKISIISDVPRCLCHFDLSFIRLIRTRVQINGFDQWKFI